MTARIGKTRGDALSLITESALAAWISCESDPALSARLREVGDLIPALASSVKVEDSDDVAQVARILSAEILQRGADLLPVQVARMAITRAVAGLLPGDRETSCAPVGGMEDVDDLRPAATGEATFGRPDACTVWTDSDRWSLAFATEDVGRWSDLLLRLASEDDAWIGGDLRTGKIGTARTGRPNMTHLAGTTSRRPTVRMTEHVRSALAAAREAMECIPASMTNVEVPTRQARGLARDYTVPTSGPASRVVTLRAGGFWVDYSDHSERVSREEAGAILRLYVLPALTVAGAASEADRPSAVVPTVERPARRPSGVGAGMRHGVTGQIAGLGTPDLRPVASRKRKRDGGIGSPMVPARG